MYMKHFNAQSAIQRTTQGVTESLASAVESIQTLIIVWYVDF